MKCECFRADIPDVIAALTDAANIEKWRASVVDELPRTADRGLAEHLRSLDKTASHLLVHGLDVVAAQDVAALDAWLTDMFAVATWNNWPIPVTKLGEIEASIENLPRGLLAADVSRQGAGLWLVTDDHIALARWRESSIEVSGGHLDR